MGENDNMCAYRDLIKPFFVIALIINLIFINSCANSYSQEYLSEVVEEITIEAQYYEYPSIVEVYSDTSNHCVVVSIYEGYAQKDKLKKDLKKRYGRVVQIQEVETLPEVF